MLSKRFPTGDILFRSVRVSYGLLMTLITNGVSPRSF